MRPAKDNQAEPERNNANSVSAADNAPRAKPIQEQVANFDKDHIWAFCAGQYSQDFRGNPKYLFIYLSKYRSDIFAYWCCENEQVIETVRSLGFHAYLASSAEAATLANRTGVLVAEQVKAEIPAGLENIKYLNLWHGVGGVKAVERSIKAGDLLPELARKYIRHNEFYRSHQLYVAPSPFIESIACDQLGLEQRQIIRAGYPRCLYQAKYEQIKTYSADLFSGRQLPQDARIAAYIPTRRESTDAAFFIHAFPDMDALVEKCAAEKILFVFKMHPYYEQDFAFLQAKEKYRDCPWLLFWDNNDDFYEVMDQVDLCIMDYSSMFTDMIAMGVKHFIRYMFDFEENALDFPINYDEATLGRKCHTFDELLAALTNYQDDDLTEDIARINRMYWEYSDDDTFERIIRETLDFKPLETQLPTLYSFDIFDTLISRKTLAPHGIFYLVREKMREDGNFPLNVIESYPSIRINAEKVAREYYRKSTDIRATTNVEIKFDDILNRIASIYCLDAEQIEKLRQWEIDAEIDNVIPLPEQITRIKQLLAQQNRIVLISDMYLPKEVICEMLRKADPALANIPLFLSNELGAMKVHRDLYYQVYTSFEPYYDFKQWIHYGDNPAADIKSARSCGITARQVKRLSFDNIGSYIVNKIGTYDSYLVAAMQTRLQETLVSSRERFVTAYVTLLMVPYIDWVLRDALRRGYKTLYFVSRDGHPLKRIADSIIAEKNLPIKTRYIYGSRRAWRIPSFIDEVDPCFWEAYANFGDIVSKEKLLGAMALTENQFREYFPSIDLDAITFESNSVVKTLVEQFKVNRRYNQYLLDYAAAKRPQVCDYLKQEIDPTEQFAIVEYWGRGYTQDTFVRLWHHTLGQKVDVPFYYSRSVLPTAGYSVRHNFTSNSTAQFFIEGFFSNMPYKSIEQYQEHNGVIEPVIKPIECDRELYEAMQSILPAYAQQYASLELRHPEETGRMLYDAALEYFASHMSNPWFAEQIGRQIDSVALYGKKREFAPALTEATVQQFAEKKLVRGDSRVSTSITMSVARTRADLYERYLEMYQILPGDNLASGRLLSDREIDRNRKFKDQYNLAVKRGEHFRDLYNEAVSNSTVTDLALFVGNGKSFGSTGFDYVLKRVKECVPFSCKKLLIGEHSDEDLAELAQLVAQAKYIIAPNAIRLFSHIKFRTGTKFIMTRSTPVYLYDQGIQKQYRLKWEEKYNCLVAHNDVSVLQVPSLNSEMYFRKNFSDNRQTDCSLLGCYGTDCYFDEAYARCAKEKLQELFPEINNRKIILYIPTVKLRRGCTDWADLLDLAILKQQLEEEYVVICSFDAPGRKALAQCSNNIEFPGFSKEIPTSKGFTIRELLICADVVVGDKRNSFFEAAMLRKPTFTTVRDIENLRTSSNMKNHGDNLSLFDIFPAISSSYDLVAALATTYQYDYTRIDRFRNWMLSGCDGRSIQRLVNYLAADYQPNEETI